MSQTLQVDVHFTQPSFVLDFWMDRMDQLPANIQQMFGAIAEITDTTSIPDSLIRLYSDIYQHYIDLHLPIPLF